MSLALSIVVPVKDEEQSIEPFVTRVRAVLEALDDPSARSFEILFIDDGSSDSTLERVRAIHLADPRVKAVSLSRNFGKEAALSAGLDFADGEAVIPIDVDLQDPPEVLGEMIAKWREGFDIVYGVRTNRDSDSLPLQALLVQGLQSVVMPKMKEGAGYVGVAAGQFRLPSQP